ncbi:hypothetical protein Micbo1qcDRAFT_159475 [Microdochium bolleyi]|uniref:Uncharacterized protein n=1 Tax=Microdochium bolleyi TaxID=196109 RepID=A0A136JB35_9PEZI|nr:hypothetical protein Micbo1qcDRAFT_159475 [Microdochium bolleyi]
MACARTDDTDSRPNATKISACQPDLEASRPCTSTLTYRAKMRTRDETVPSSPPILRRAGSRRRAGFLRLCLSG